MTSDDQAKKEVVDWPAAVLQRPWLTRLEPTRTAGVVTSTWLRGKKIDFQTPQGRMLRRGGV